MLSKDMIPSFLRQARQEVDERVAALGELRARYEEEERDLIAAG